MTSTMRFCFALAWSFLALYWGLEATKARSAGARRYSLGACLYYIAIAGIDTGLLLDSFFNS